MPPKRASKRQASKSSTQAVSAKQRRSEGKSASLPNSTTSSPQFSLTALSELISNAISGALQSAGIGTLNISPAVGEQRPSNQSTSQPTVVEDAASKEIADLTNTVAAGRLTFASEKPDGTFSSVIFDLESRVSDRIKAKIWANEYVDFGSLLSVSPDESKYRLSVANDHDHPSLCLEHVKPKRRSLSIDQWVTAFNVFVAVYTIRVPKATSSLISDYLIQGFIHGFSIRYFGSPLAIRSPNLKSTMDNPTSVNNKLSKELAAGRIVGPYDTPPFETFRVSPLGIVPKKLPGEFRLIHHLSYPEGLSVNDGIPKELATRKICHYR